MKLYLVLTLSAAVVFLFATQLLLVEACNEAICAPLVSKCLLIKCCDCDMTNKGNCTCCKECQLCLSKLYSECCSCVGMCPPPNPEDSIFKSSSIEDLADPIPELFNVLTEEEDPELRWTSHSYPVHFNALSFKTSLEISELNVGKDHTDHQKFSVAGPYNCTVAFMSQCMSLRKCKQSCKSMGAAKYRWFHEEGCCQCIGDACIDYGLNEAKCIKCPNSDNDVVEEDDYIDIETK
ncbi:hypothetical protein ACJMK2_010308 [Sinanodonta woodiana]|uniref:Protein twisted gastrulation n=1 Tax=Sinanodonta woodiana TaxID=1069815 RepID=A0ABD3VHX5_SINWO